MYEELPEKKREKKNQEIICKNMIEKVYLYMIKSFSVYFCVKRLAQ